MEAREETESNPYLSTAPASNEWLLTPMGRGYSIAALFFCVTLIAVLTAIARHVFRLGEFRLDLPLAVSIVIEATILGAIVGAFHHRRLRGAFLGVALGALAGVFVGIIGASDQFAVPVVVCLGASLFLFSSAVVFRWLSAGRRREVTTWPTSEISTRRMS